MSKKILFISNHASFFCTHRLNIFKESVRRKLGFRLIFGNSASKSMDKHAIKILNQQKVNYIKLKYSHNSINFFKDISSIIKIIKVIKDFFPDVIHSASPKANLLLCVISKIIKVKLIVLSMSGLGIYLLIKIELLHIRQIYFY